MSSNATSETDSNVTVATLSDESITFQNVGILDDKSIVFGAEAGDIYGRLMSNGKDDACLSIVISGKINNAQGLGKLSAKLDLPNEIQNAVTAGYIVAPDCANSAVTLYTSPNTSAGEFEHDNFHIEINEGKATFTYSLAFAWGDKFGGMNPSLYYDNHEVGKTVPDDEMATQMQAFHSVITGSSDGQTSQLAYKLTISATAASSM
jgi:hypothetical protein